MSPGAGRLGGHCGQVGCPKWTHLRWVTSRKAAHRPPLGDSKAVGGAVAAREGTGL